MKPTADDKRRRTREKRVYRDSPVGINLFARRVCRTNPDDEQDKVLEKYRKHNRVAIKAAHGVGKTHIGVIGMFHQLYCYPNSIVPCTAPTLHQLRNVLWTEAARFLNRSPILKAFFVITKTRIMVRGFEDIWYAVALPSSNANALAGLHEKNLLYILDEAPGISEAAFPVIEGALSDMDNKCIAIGNPTKNHGYIHSLFRKPMGWGTHTISRLDSNLPNQDKEYPKRIADRFGVDSNIYRVRVLGEFPKSEDDSIIPIDAVLGAMNRSEPLIQLNVIEAGCDVARFGQDRTIIYVRHGFKVIDFFEAGYDDTVATQDAILRLIPKYKITKFKIDEGTFGGGVVDNVRMECKRLGYIYCEVIGVMANQRAVNDQLFENATIEMYWNLRETLTKAVIPDDEELLGELTGRTYHTHRSTFRLTVQPKDEYANEMRKKGHVGFASPDKADALALCFGNFRPRHSDGVVRVPTDINAMDFSGKSKARKDREDRKKRATSTRI